MHSLTALAIGLLGLAQAQNVILQDPRTRFNDSNIVFPPFGYPILHSSLSPPPNCGEDSYVGHGRLVGRKALITGGDSGIGRAIAIAYMREGASIAINYLPEEESDAQALADFLVPEFPDRPLIRIPGDLTNETFCGDLVHQAYTALDGLDIVVNNAGYGGVQNGPEFHNITSHPTSQLERVFRTNFFAPFYITRAAIPLLPPGASILFTTSALAATPVLNALDYAASKAALSHFIQGLSLQIGASTGIRVNGVAWRRS